MSTHWKYALIPLLSQIQNDFFSFTIFVCMEKNDKSYINLYQKYRIFFDKKNSYFSQNWKQKSKIREHPALANPLWNTMVTFIFLKTVSTKKVISVWQLATLKLPFLLRTFSQNLRLPSCSRGNLRELYVPGFSIFVFSFEKNVILVC